MENLRLLHDPLVRAVERLRLPFLSDVPIFGQVVREQRFGLRLLGRLRRVPGVELGCTPARGRVPTVRGVFGALDVLVARAMSAHVSRQDELALQFHHAVRRSLLDVSLHDLDAGAHDLPAPVHLANTLEEVAWATPDPLRRRDPFSERQTEVVTLLATTGASYDELAQQLGVAPGTLRKHVELAYRSLAVHSRAELCVLWREARGDGGERTLQQRDPSDAVVQSKPGRRRS